MPAAPADPFDDDADATRGVSTSFYRDETAVTREALLERLLMRADDSEKYIIVRQVAEGGMGTVFEVLDQDLKRTNVLKVMRPEVERDPHLFERFVEEARITGRLEHPNIVPVHELGVLGGQKLFFSMKMVHGEELADILTRLRGGDAQTTHKYGLYPLLTIFRKVCDATAFAHSRGIIHRDLKPDNVMVGEYGEVLLMDWGLARHSGDRRLEPEPEFDPTGEEEDTLADPDDGRTRFGVIKGTPAYMSPEQALGRVDLVDFRSDIFLLGATLYTIATLYPPFTGKDVYEIVDNAGENNFIPPQARAPHRQIPSELSRIILRAMATEQNDRYQSVTELAADLDALMAGETASERRTFAAGEMLMSEGEAGDEAYVLLSGIIEVFKIIDGEAINLVTLGEGDVVGEMAMISDAPRSASVRAVTDAEAVVITKETMKRGLSHLPPWMEQVIGAVVDRLRSASSSIHPLMRADCSWQVLQLLRFCYITWGRPALSGGNLIITLESRAAVEEIASLICLPRERIIELLSSLCHSGLATLTEDDHIIIPNMDLFTSFIEFLQRRAGHTTPFSDDPHTYFFANGNCLAVHHYLPTDEAEEPFEQVYQNSVDEVLGRGDDDAVLELFEVIRNDLYHAQLPQAEHSHTDNHVDVSAKS